MIRVVDSVVIVVSVVVVDEDDTLSMNDIISRNPQVMIVPQRKEYINPLSKVIVLVKVDSIRLIYI